jgi:hypothetical protein
VSPSSQARIAGLVYLVLALTSGPAQFFRESLLVTGDATETAAKVRDNADALRLALAADLIGVAAFVCMSLILWAIFREVGPRAATALLVLVGVAATLQAADLSNHAAAYLLTGQPASPANDQLVSLFINLHRQGYYVAQVFFGLWLVPFGWLVWQTAWLPRVLGLGLIAGGILYVVALVPVYASPSLTSDLNTVISMPAGIAEIATGIWLAAVGLTERGRLEAGHSPQATVTAAA